VTFFFFFYDSVKYKGKRKQEYYCKNEAYAISK